MNKWIKHEDGLYLIDLATARVVLLDSVALCK